MDFVILSLAVWRLSAMLSQEKGPWDVFAKLRERLGVKEDELSRYGTSQPSMLIVCLWCLSVWIGFIVAVFYYFLPGETVAVALVLSLSSGAILIEETLDKLMRL